MDQHQLNEFSLERDKIQLHLVKGAKPGPSP
jgi:hypothetical protein